MTAIKGPSLADLRTTLARQVETLAGRLRGWSPGDWEQPSANPGWSNADTVRHLAEALAIYAVGVERRDQATRPSFDEARQSGAGAAALLPRRLADASERLVEALGKTETAEPVWHPGHRFSARTMAAVGLSEVVLHRWDLTGPGDRGPEPRAARLVLQGVFAPQDDSSANPIALLLHVAGRVRMESRPGWRGPDWGWDIPDEVPHAAPIRPGRVNLPARLRPGRVNLPARLRPGRVNLPARRTCPTTVGPRATVSPPTQRAGGPRRSPWTRPPGRRHRWGGEPARPRRSPRP